VLSIYDLNGDEMKLCLRRPGNPQGRPTAFATERNSDLVLMVLKREKPEAKVAPIQSKD
jgi:hypothetical protein